MEGHTTLDTGNPYDVYRCLLVIHLADVAAATGWGVMLFAWYIQ